MQLVIEGKLMIPLFHRTSTLFLDDILTLGLGTVSPKDKYKIMETLANLVERGKEYSELLPSCERNVYLQEAKMLVNQTGKNYRYGGVFFTPSLFTAVRYSSHNRYGSELIEFFHYLKEHSVPVELENEYLRQIMNNTYEPVIIKTSEIDISWLEAEDSTETKEGQLEWLQSIIDEHGIDELDEWSQQTNFELVKGRILSPDKFTVLSSEEYQKQREKYGL